VDMHATDLVGINGITRVLLVYTVGKVYTLEATYYPLISFYKIDKLIFIIEKRYVFFEV
jgi:hypothetical protein